MFSIPLFLFPYTLVTKGLTYLLPPNKTKRKKYLHSFTLIHTRYFNEDYPFLGLRYFWLPDKSPAVEGLEPVSITSSIIDTARYLSATEAPTTISDWDILTNKWTCLQNQSTHVFSYLRQISILMEITYKVHVYHKFLKVIISKVHHPPRIITKTYGNTL